MEKKNLINVEDELDNVTALVALIQQTTALEGDFSFNETAKNGLYIFLSNILDRLNLIQSLLQDETIGK